LNNYKKKLQ